MRPPPAREQEAPLTAGAAEQGPGLEESCVAVGRRSGRGVETGGCQGHREVALSKDGPVTLMLETGGSAE